MTCADTYLDVARCNDAASTDEYGFTYDDLSFVCDQYPELYAQLVDTYIFS